MVAARRKVYSCWSGWPANRRLRKTPARTAAFLPRWRTEPGV